MFFDRLNHASLYQAVFLSKAKLIRYYHNDIYHLQKLLEEYKNDPRPKFIVTETLFGMDGDVAPLTEIAEFAKIYNAFLYLDEAHATGIYGSNGYGLSVDLSLKDIPHIIMGTFSKALGSSGGYIGCSSIMKEYIINKAQGFIYSTAPSPANVGAAMASWQLIKELGAERVKLEELSQYARSNLRKNGFNIGKSITHIIPIIIGSEEACLNAKNKLLEQNIILSAIRPPTVPPNTSRLRIAICSKHTKEDIDQLIYALKNVKN